METKRKREGQKMKIVEIVWTDARAVPELLEQELEDYEPFATYRCVGYLLRETEKAILICIGFLPKTDERDETIYRHILSIPKCLIKKITIIRKKV